MSPPLSFDRFIEKDKSALKLSILAFLNRFPSSKRNRGAILLLAIITGLFTVGVCLVRDPDQMLHLPLAWRNSLTPVRRPGYCLSVPPCRGSLEHPRS